MNNSNMVSGQDGLPLKKAPFFDKIGPITVDKKDRIYAWLIYLLGYGFIYTFTSYGVDRNLRVFTIVYLIFMMSYFIWKKKQIPREAYFWIVIVACLGLTVSEQGLIYPLVQIPALLFAAAYLVLCLGGNLLEKQGSSQWIIIDLWNAVIEVPFYNFFCRLKIVAGNKKEDETHRYTLWTILLGIGITIPILIIILPLLGRADQQFANILLDFRIRFWSEIWFFVPRILFSLPVSAYLFALMYGSAYKRNTDHFLQADVKKSMRKGRIIPNLAIYIMMIVVCIVYVLFIGLQGSYLFSAFRGAAPEAYTYAEYARQGFFELCRVAVINLSILTVVNSFCVKMRSESPVLRWMNVLLSVLTIFLVITAMSKMILYISGYGLTEKRIITMVFMLWLLLVFVLMIIWQFRRIPLVKISFLTGTVLFTLLCMIPLKRWMELFQIIS